MPLIFKENSGIRGSGGATIPAGLQQVAARPALARSAVPEAKSYVVIMADHDAKPILPFLHWAARNIPPTVLMLPVSLQE